jgi:hypothetical protein
MSTHFLYFTQIQNFPWANCIIILKKNYCEKLKAPLDLKFKFFDFKCIFIVLLCILIVYYFLYSGKYQIAPQLIITKNHCEYTKNTSRNLTNTNVNTDKKILLVDCDKFYRQTFSLLYPLVNTNENVMSIYTEGNAVENEGI